MADRDRLGHCRRPDGPGTHADQGRIAHDADARLRRPHSRRRGGGDGGYRDRDGYDDFKGRVPRGFVVLKAGVGTDPAVLSAELVQLVRDQIGPVAALRRVDVITALPKTRSGKILRKTMRGIADGRDEVVPSTIEDPAVLEVLRPVLTNRDDKPR